MKKTVYVAITILLIAAYGTFGRCQTRDEQRVFNAEDATLQKPVPIPHDILQLLSTDSDVKNAAEGQLGSISMNWFSGSIVSTARPLKKLYLIVGNGPLIGAHVTTFWLVGRPRPESSPVVLLKTVADRLEVGKPDASGYPRVTVVQLTATSTRDTTYRFASGKYTPIHPVD